MKIQGVPGVMDNFWDLIPEQMLSQNRHASSSQWFRSYEFL